MEGQDQLTLARDLVEALATGERGQADRIVNALARGVESSVCSQVATMTEGLRKALADLEGDVGVAGMTLHEIPDVRDRLHYIIAKTERLRIAPLARSRRYCPWWNVSPGAPRS